MALRWSAGFGGMPPFYRYVAPLGLKASVKYGAVGNSGYRSRGSLKIVIQPVWHIALRKSAGFGGFCPAIDMSLRWSGRLPLRTAQFGNSTYLG